MQGSELKLEKLKEKCDHSSVVGNGWNIQTKNNLNPTCMENIFTEKEVQYNLRSKNHLQLPNVTTANMEMKILST